LAGLELEGVAKRFGDTAVLHPTSLHIADGEFVVIVGPSGCGKSTLLRMIAGLEAPSAGTIRIGGRDVTDAAPADRGVAMVFQSYALYPHLTVAENIAFPLTVAKMPKADARARVAEMAAMLGLGALLDRRPKALSGGQRQRVAIGRALVRRPQVLLLDEPLSNLDSHLRVAMRHEFARLHQETGTTMVYVTHDQVEAMTLANRIVVMAGGHVEQVGAPMDVYRRPASLKVAVAIGSPAINLLPVTVEATGAETRVRLADGQAVALGVATPDAARGQAATLGVRPEHLHLAEDGPFRGRVELFERLGPLSFVHLGERGHASTVVAQLPSDAPATMGAELRFCCAPDQAHLFDSNGRAFPAYVEAT